MRSRNFQIKDVTTDDFKGNENAIYNKIFLKFKDKNDNNTIEINEFNEEPNTNN